MNIVNLQALPEEEQRSPSGKFHSYSRNVSVALGGIRHAGTWGGGHPFDFQIRRLPPGAAVCPFHLHLAQWELFLVRSGRGTVRAGTETHAVGPGEVFVHPPGEPHQLINSGPTDLEVFIFADNPPLDAFYYPDSDKWGMRPPGKIFRMSETDYFDGEDPATGGDGKPHQPSAAPRPASATPFLQRKVRLDDIAWEPWESPKGKFRATGKGISLALGAKPNAPTGLGGHPFDLELGRIAPGARCNPYHSHAAQWELFIIMEGTATVRAADATAVLQAGEVVLHPPGEAHGLANSGPTDLYYLLVADNPPVDYWHYPDSGKWGFPVPRKYFRAQETAYYDGEE
ncbi:MAG: cupin domain-containing protein [Opitutales bacterium]